jgi:dTDP-4-dehydrorhamnose reductase
VTKKVLVLGATGLLGSEILYQLSKVAEVDLTASVRDSTSLSTYYQSSSSEILQFDALNFIDSPNVYEIEKYDVVINAIGAIKQRGMSKDHLYLLNTELPKILAKKLIDTESRVIHFTTDCVFQGDRNNLKTERTPHDATDDYGKSKSLGEISQHNFWNLRASFIGAETNSNLSLLNWFLNQKMGALIDGYVNHIWNGITVVDYAMIISRIVEHSAFPENRVLHLIPADEISKYDLLKMFGRYFDREDIIVNKYSGSENVYRKIDTDFPAQNLNLWNLTGRVKLPSIEELIAELALEYKSRNYFVGKQFRRTD